MPLPRAVARANRRLLNPVMRRVAPWAPLIGEIGHVGRRSGRTYRTPVFVFGDGDHRVVALTYGEDTDWVRNVLAAGGCELRSRRRRFVASEPLVRQDDTGDARLPWLVRRILRVSGVHAYLHLRVRPADG